MTKAEQDKVNAVMLNRAPARLPRGKGMNKQDIADKLTDAHDLLIRAMFFIQANGLEVPKPLKDDLNKHFKRRVKNDKD